MIDRVLSKQLLADSRQFKAILLTGPRQSGKTTLARATFSHLPYVSFENPDTRLQARADMRSFLNRYADGAIFDEAQRVPELFSYLQQRLDESEERGRYVITGSQNLSLTGAVAQSLAGRVSALELMPLSYDELSKAGTAPASRWEAVFKGGYPALFATDMDVVRWLESYVGTYLERDVRSLLDVRSLVSFQQFLALAAGNVGQLLNAQRLSADCGISANTAKQWFSVLEGSFVTYRLPSHSENFRKKTVKTPKINFVDTGLACRLMGIENFSQLETHPLRGNLFENWVVSEIQKSRMNLGRKSSMGFWRGSNGLEVDLILNRAGKLQPIEIKSGSTFSSDWVKNIIKWMEIAGEKCTNPILVYGGEEEFFFKGIHVIPWNQLSKWIVE